MESRYYTFTPLSLNFHAGQRLQYGLTHNFERLFKPFEIHQGIAIPAGRLLVSRTLALFSKPLEQDPCRTPWGMRKGHSTAGRATSLTGTLSWRKSANLTAGC